MRLTSLNYSPFYNLPYWTSGSGGKPRLRSLPFHRATATGLPASVNALACMSDLQGREYLSGTFRGSERLLGEAVAGKLLSMISSEEIPALDALLVAGDLYDYPDCRKPGGTGDINDALHALSAVTPDTLCVLGNHDTLSSAESLPASVQILDGQTITLNSGLMIGGVSGIIGDPKRHNRRTESGFLEIMETVTRKNPDLLILHQGPEDTYNKRLGDPAVALSLETGFRGLTIFGHTHWPRDFLIELGDGQAVNVDSRLIVITRSDR